MYASCEPCFMCSGAMIWLNLGRLVYGAGNAELEVMLGNPPRESSKLVFANSFRQPEVTGGVLREEALQILEDYFCNHEKG